MFFDEACHPEGVVFDKNLSINVKIVTRASSPGMIFMGALLWMCLLL